MFFGTLRPASIVCVTASAAPFSAGSSRLTSLGPLQSSTEWIFNLLLSPYYGIIVTIGRERSRANEVTIVSNSVKAILGHFDASSQLMPHCHAYSWPTRSRRTALHHCSSGFRFFLKPRFFSPHLLLHLRKTRSDGSRMRLQIPGVPRNLRNGARLGQRRSFRFNGAPRSLSTSDQIKL